MQTFATIYKRAARRHGGVNALEERLVRPKSRRALRRLKDDRMLAAMTRSVFQAGFVWRVVEAKWSGFEEAFHGFAPQKVARLSNARLARLRTDERIIRNPVKIQATRDNAIWLVALAKEHGSAAHWLADWPEDDVVVGLWSEIKQRGCRLGGMTGQFFLRSLGKDTPMMTQDVVAALRRQGVVETKSASSKQALARAQEAFNSWREQSGRSLCEISRILACSEGEVREPRY
jgi:3-methyladenine DNA glycosylase Tag